MTNVFLSHNHNDKPVVEPVALKLRDILGQESVFYDSWSIKPGDGIIDQMNNGLSSPDFVFVFASINSMSSKMVAIEWQNALFQSTKGKCKIVPIRVDGTPIPPVMSQNLYIDMHTHGIDIAIHQIVNIIQGNNSFTPQHMGFSNLSWDAKKEGDGNLHIRISASHLMEPNKNFAFMCDNSEGDLKFETLDKSPTMNGFAKKFEAFGVRSNTWVLSPLGGAITPDFPLEIEIVSKSKEEVNLKVVMHKINNTQYRMVPRKTFSDYDAASDCKQATRDCAVSFPQRRESSKGKEIPISTGMTLPTAPLSRG